MYVCYRTNHTDKMYKHYIQYSLQPSSYLPNFPSAQQLSAQLPFSPAVICPTSLQPSSYLPNFPSAQQLSAQLPFSPTVICPTSLQPSSYLPNFPSAQQLSAQLPSAQQLSAQLPFSPAVICPTSLQPNSYLPNWPSSLISPLPLPHYSDEEAMKLIRTEPLRKNHPAAGTMKETQRIPFPPLTHTHTHTHAYCNIAYSVGYTIGLIPHFFSSYCKQRKLGGRGWG